MPLTSDDDFWLRPLVLDARSIALMDEIVERVAAGETVAAICKSNHLMPNRRSITRWQREVPEFKQRMNEARRLRSLSLVDDALHIADTPQMGIAREYERIKVIDLTLECGYRYEMQLTKEKAGDMLEHRKLQIHTRLKMAEMENPDEYGPRIKHEVTVNIADRIRIGRERAALIKQEAIGYVPRVIEHNPDTETTNDDEFADDE